MAAEQSIDFCIDYEFWLGLRLGLPEGTTILLKSRGGISRDMTVKIPRAGENMLNSEQVSPSVRKAVIQQLKKGGYKLPSLQSFNIAAYGTVGHVLYAGNM